MESLRLERQIMVMMVSDATVEMDPEITGVITMAMKKALAPGDGFGPAPGPSDGDGEEDGNGE